MNCPNCNKELPDGLSFCTTCGTPIPQQSAPPQPPTNVPQPEPPETTPPKKKKSKVLVITSIVTAIALLLGCGAGWYFLWGPGAKSTTSDTEMDSKVTVYAIATVDEYSEDGTHYMHIGYAYNDYGRMTKYEVDLGAWGEWDEETGSYNDHCEPIDGIADRITLAEYGDHGELTRLEFEINNEPITFVLDWEMDENGHPGSATAHSNAEDGATMDLLFSHEDGKLTSVYGIANSTDHEEGYLSMIQYDKEGRIYSEIVNEYYRYRYEFDEDGRLTQITTSDNDIGSWDVEQIKEYYYDSEGRLTRVVETDDEGEETYRAEYEYDSKGNLVDAIRESSYSHASFSDFTYDGDIRRSCVCTRDIGNGEIHTFLCEYDENGNLIKETDGDGSYICYSYQRLELSKEDAEAYYRQERLDDPYFDWMRVMYAHWIPTPVDPEGMLGL